MDEPFRVRPAADADLAEIAAIERAVFSDPWPRSSFRGLVGQCAWVADARGSVIGYLFGRVAADEAEVLNLAVRPARRRTGVGHALLETALARFWTCGARTVYLEVREANEEARRFYSAHGFRPVGKRPRYYRNPPEDAVVMARPIGPEKMRK
jgi:ribosomal-protein-alanine acetyltransferase